MIPPMLRYSNFTYTISMIDYVRTRLQSSEYSSLYERRKRSETLDQISKCEVEVALLSSDRHFERGLKRKFCRVGLFYQGWERMGVRLEIS